MIKPIMFDEILNLALREDIGTGDITTASTVPADEQMSAQFIAKSDGMCCGMFVAKRIFELVDPGIVFATLKDEGETMICGEIIATVSGSARSILTGERTALNLLQRLSGIATKTAEYCAQIKDYHALIADTRKTTPGLRVLEKYAVRVGGGINHRFNLSDGVLIKDNHIKAAGSITAAVKMSRKNVPFVLKTEVECADMDMVREAVDAGADIIMLDNMNIEQMQAAVKFIAGRAVVEASGNMDKRDLVSVAACGVDIISVGALTHSVQSLDISLKFV